MRFICFSINPAYVCARNARNAPFGRISEAAYLYAINTSFRRAYSGCSCPQCRPRGRRPSDRRARRRRPLAVDAVRRADLALVARVDQRLLQALHRVAPAAPIQQAIARACARTGRGTSRRPVSRRNTEAAACPNRQCRSRSGRCGSGNCARRDRCCCQIAVCRAAQIAQRFQAALERNDRRFIAIGARKRIVAIRGITRSGLGLRRIEGAAGSRYPPCR